MITKMKYRVKFEFFGKHMQTLVVAENEKHAKKIVKDRINFLSIENEPETTPPPMKDNEVMDFLFGTFGWKK